jgi:PAS domain S-box-containing protein
MNGIILILITLLLISPKMIHAQAESPPLDTVYLKLKWKHQFQFAGYYAAIEKGYYREAGLEVIMLEPNQSEESVQCVVSGKAQYGIASSDLLQYRNNGYPVVLLANIFQHSPYVFLSLKHDHADNIHDLSGKSLMLEEHAAELKAYLELERIAIDQMTIIPHSFSPDALIDSTAFAMSAYSTDEPFLLSEKGIEYNVFNPRSSGIDFYGDVLFTSEDEIENNPERVKEFLEASLKGWRYALKNEKEIINLIFNNYSQRHSKDHLFFEAEQTKRLIMPEVVEIGYVNHDRWKRIGEIYADLNMLTRDFSLDGFVYDRNPQPDLKKLVLPIIGGIAGMLFLSLIAFRYYLLNKRLKQESKERIKNEEMLKLAEERYRNLAEHAPLPIFITNPETGQILYLNDSACKMLEITKELALKRPASDFYVFPDQRKKVIDKINNQGFVKDTEFLMKTAGKKKFHALVSSNIITFDNRPALFSGILDISNRIYLEKELIKANADKNQLFSIIAHDLKGPISALDGLLKLLIHSADDISPSKQKEILLRLKDSTKVTFELIDNLLKWSLSKRGKIEFQPVDYSVNELIKNNVMLFEESALKKQINLNTELDESMTFKFDLDMMNLVVRNLINNAIKFSDHDSEITIRAKVDPTQMLISVEDDGIGMSEERKGQLFEIDKRSARMPGTAGEIGSGLGLILCKEFIERHDGKIQVESELGKGTTFVVELPNRN